MTLTQPIKHLLGALTAFTFSVSAQAQTNTTPDTTPATANEEPAPSDVDWSNETLVVTPTKFAASPEDVGSAVTLLPAKELKARQIRTFREALQIVPGVTLASSGQPGSVSSVFLRGVNSNQTQFLVDGIRISDSNVFSNNFIGGAVTHNLQAIEILRGPQSALYGGEAIGGVISLWSPRGEGDPSGELQLGGGSFGTFHTQLSSMGEAAASAYSFSAGWETTDNDRSNNDFENLYYATRIDHALSDRTEIGFTLRGAPPRPLNPREVSSKTTPDNSDEEEFLLLTASIGHYVNDLWHTPPCCRVVEPESHFQFSTSRLEPDRQREGRPRLAQHRRVDNRALPLCSESASKITASSTPRFGSIDDTETLVAAYLQQSLKITEAFTLTGGARWEDYDSFGDVLTWRVAGAYGIEATGTTPARQCRIRLPSPVFLRAPCYEQFPSSVTRISSPRNRSDGMWGLNRTSGRWEPSR